MKDQDATYVVELPSSFRNGTESNCLQLYYVLHEIVIK